MKVRNLIMTYLGSMQQAVDANKHDSLGSIAPENTIRAVEISFYDHEIYAGDELIASISHDADDFVTQRWVVMVNGVEIHRSNTWAKCDSYIRWHYTQKTLPQQQQQVEATTGNEIMAQIATECEKFEFDIFDDGIYYNDTKLGEVGCTDGNWWITTASSQQHHKILCDSACSAVWLLWILLASPDTDKRNYFVEAQSGISHIEGLLDKPCDELTTIEWEQLKKYKPLPENMVLLTA
jgi:hypothetical protein